MSEALLKVKGLKKTFGGIKALKGVDLTIDAGEIHCFAGINGSGKSTMVKCVSGIYEPDAGEISLNGTTFSKLTPQQGIENGVQVIYQDLSLFAHLTIAENIAINSLLNSKKKIINQKDIYSIAKAQMEKIGVELELNKTIQESTMAACQLTAICRALAMDAKIIFMDEPTTALTQREIKRLLGVVSDLKKKGYAIVFISHKLDEIFEIADKISVFRDGEIVGNYHSHELDKKKLAMLMTGRDVEYPFYQRSVQDDTPVLRVENLSKVDNYQDISFEIRPGDILGLTGLLGSGRTELGLTLFGLNKATKGNITFSGKKLSGITPSLMNKLGLCLLPENRAVQGLFIDQSIRENISSVVLDSCSNRFGILDRQKEAQLTERIVQEMNIKIGSPEDPINTLSGGNQQKAVIGKWIAGEPKLFIMDSPTVGIDVGSKAEIYERIQQFAAQGMAILFISDEADEIIANCNRIMVMSQGKQLGFIEEDERNSMSRDALEEKILRMMGSDLAPANPQKGGNANEEA